MWIIVLVDVKPNVVPVMVHLELPGRGSGGREGGTIDGWFVGGGWGELVGVGGLWGGVVCHGLCLWWRLVVCEFLTFWVFAGVWGGGQSLGVCWRR